MDSLRGLNDIIGMNCGEERLNEAIILKSLKEEQQNKTIVIVSHRKSTLAFCDDKVTVENGRLA